MQPGASRSFWHWLLHQRRCHVIQDLKLYHMVVGFHIVGGRNVPQALGLQETKRAAHNCATIPASNGPSGRRAPIMPQYPRLFLCLSVCLANHTTTGYHHRQQQQRQEQQRRRQRQQHQCNSNIRKRSNKSDKNNNTKRQQQQQQQQQQEQDNNNNNNKNNKNNNNNNCNNNNNNYLLNAERAGSAHCGRVNLK